MIVVSDSTPLISLLKIRRLTLLRDLFQKVLIPGRVLTELTGNPYFEKEAEQIRQASYIETLPVTDHESVRSLCVSEGLDAGESEAIIMSGEVHAGLLLMDEKKGREIARKRGLRVMGTIGVLSVAYRENILSEEELRGMIDVLKSEHRHISNRLYQHLLRQLRPTPKFEIPRPEDARNLIPYFTMRPCKACESGWIDYFIWADYYRVRYYEMKDEALLIIMKNEREYFAALPYCAEEKIAQYFQILKGFFNDVLEQPFKIYLADEEGVDALGLKENPAYIVREEENFRDYLYDAEELRTLPGRKYQKKRNLINKFIKDHEGRWEYRSLSCDNRAEVLEFLDSWFPNHAEEDADGATTLRFERDGLTSVLQDCCHMTYRIGGITIDGKLKAFSLGTYNAREEMACISVEKADPEIPGLYQLINREFLAHAFPEAKLVNREDDMGLPGVRKAKLSYNPVAFEKKYMISEKTFRGKEVEIFDPYEDEVAHFKDREEDSLPLEGKVAAPKVLTDEVLP